MSLKNLAIATALAFAYKNYWARVKSVEGERFVVTGAASGLGKEVAKLLASRKAQTLVLVDINEELLKASAAEIKSAHPKVEVHTYKVNLAKSSEIYDFARKVLSTVGDIDCVINNAGIVSGKYLLESNDELDELTMRVNTLSHIWMTKAFLPAMEKRGKGHFVNVSSMASFVGGAGMVVYAASKYGARGFAEALNAEFRQRRSPVKVSCVCPSHFNTDLFKGFHVTGNLMMSPEYVAQQTVDAYEYERELTVLPKYLIPSMPVMSLFQTIGMLNIPMIDKEHPMANWAGEKHAQERFKLMLAGEKKQGGGGAIAPSAVSSKL